MALILLIEDHQVVRENTARLLELAGYTVQTAENGKPGVKKALKSRPDLVVCDIMMPVLDGYGVLRMALGTDDYVSKPFGKAALLRSW